MFQSMFSVFIFTN